MMNSIAQNTEKTYSLLRFIDLFGTGYLVQEDVHTAAAISEGWDVIMSGRTKAEADYAHNLYKTAGQPQGATATPDLSDLLTYDFTSEIEDRDSSVAEEFDLVELEWNGRVIEGTITYHDEDTVEIDGFIEVSPTYFLKHATLIAKADSDSGFMKTYGAWLTKLDENQKELFAYAAKAQNQLKYGEVA